MLAPHMDVVLNLFSPHYIPPALFFDQHLFSLSKCLIGPLCCFQYFAPGILADRQVARQNFLNPLGVPYGKLRKCIECHKGPCSVCPCPCPCPSLSGSHQTSLQPLHGSPNDKQVTICEFSSERNNFPLKSSMQPFMQIPYGHNFFYESMSHIKFFCLGVTGGETGSLQSLAP